jgi:protein-S-isoprenylcysteine O-methyltransferase Ste14
LLRKPAFYLLASAGYFGLCYLLWRPIPASLSPPARAVALAIGGLLYFSGLALVLWGRLVLGKLYFVSTSRGAELFAGHQLITGGPYALVRHPMYVGILMAGLGGMLLYRTWTFVFFALNFLGLILRARREEEALAAEFGDHWLDYCRRVPRWVPRLPQNRLMRWLE